MYTEYYIWVLTKQTKKEYIFVHYRANSLFLSQEVHSNFKNSASFIVYVLRSSANSACWL